MHVYFVSRQISMRLAFLYCTRNHIFLSANQTFLSLFDIRQFDLFYWLTAMNLLVVSFTAGVGTAGVFGTIKMFNELRKFDLQWEPLHEGRSWRIWISSFFALCTALSFSCGVIIVPSAYSFVEQGTLAVKIVGWLVADKVFYSIWIAMSFVIPMIFISTKSAMCRMAYLGALRRYIYSLLGDGSSYQGQSNNGIAIVDIDTLGR